MNRINLLFNILIGLFIIAFTFLAVHLNAQTVGEIYADDDGAYLILGEDADLPSFSYNLVKTESGNYTINAVWYLSEANSYVPDKGTNKVYLEAYFNYDDGGKGDIGVVMLGETENPAEIELDDFETQTRATINKHGKCHVVIQYNSNE